MSTDLRNWAGNLTYHAARLHCPDTVEQVQEIVAGARLVKGLGSRHSFNDAADTVGELVSTERMNRIVAVDADARSVTVEGGIRYGELSAELHRQGWGLPNLASLPHISVAGACATATHGSGVGNGCLATSVRAMEIVTASGELLRLERGRDGERFEGAVVHLGALGIATRLTLDLVPTYSVRQDVYERLTMAQLEEHFAEITGSGYSVSLFTDWRGGLVRQVWRKRVAQAGDDAAAEPEWFGATRADGPRHPLPGIDAASCTPQMGVPGPWPDRLPHFRLDYTPSNGEELQTEYLVPIERGPEALQAVRGLGQIIAPSLQITELRTIAPDTLWMSPFREQRCLGVHFTWRKDWPTVRGLLPQIEERLAPLGARPHWGKLFTMPAPQVQARFPKLAAFRDLAARHDPERKFRNAFLDEYVYAGA